MGLFSLVQFEDRDGAALSEILQVPNTIEAGQLRELANTTQELYLNGLAIMSTLEDAMRPDQLADVEQVKKIRLSEDLPATQPALYCSSTYSGHEGPVLAAKFGGDILVTAGGDRTVRFWDLITKTQFNIVSKHSHWVVCLDADERHVVSGGMDRLVHLYDHKGSHLQTLARHRDGVTAVRLNGDRIISVSRDSTCIVWGTDGSFVASWSHKKPITALCVEGEYVLTAGADQAIRVYRNYRYHCDLKGHAARVNCLEMRGGYVVSGDDSGAVIVWKNLALHKRMAHKKEVISLSIGPNGMSFATASFDKTVRLWNIETGEALASYFHASHVYRVRVLSDLIISCSKDKTVKMFKISRQKLVSDLVCEDEVYDFDYLNGHLVSGTKSGKVYFFN